MKLKKYINIIFIFVFLLNNISSYSFILEDIDFNQRMDTLEGGYRELNIINNNLVKQRYKINVLPSKINDGSKFVQVYPKVITIEPKSKGLVKVFGKAPATTTKGEYRFNLQFQPINIPTLAKAREGMTVGNTNIRVAPIVEMRGYVGEIDFEKAIKFENIIIEKNLKNEGIILKGQLSNNSYASIDFGVEAYGSNDFFYGSAQVVNLLGNTKNKDIQFQFPMITDKKSLKKIIFYRSLSEEIENIKEIEINK